MMLLGISSGRVTVGWTKKVNQRKQLALRCVWSWASTLATQSRMTIVTNTAPFTMAALAPVPIVYTILYGWTAQRFQPDVLRHHLVSTIQDAWWLILVAQNVQPVVPVLFGKLLQHLSRLAANHCFHFNIHPTIMILFLKILH